MIKFLNLGFPPTSSPPACAPALAKRPVSQTCQLLPALGLHLLSCFPLLADAELFSHTKLPSWPSAPSWIDLPEASASQTSIPRTVCKGHRPLNDRMLLHAPLLAQGFPGQRVTIGRMGLISTPYPPFLHLGTRRTRGSHVHTRHAVRKSLQMPEVAPAPFEKVKYVCHLAHHYLQQPLSLCEHMAQEFKHYNQLVSRGAAS